MDYRKVAKLIKLLEESEVSEIEIREGEESIRISRGSSVSHVAVPAATHLVTPQQAPTPQAAPVITDKVPATALNTGETIKSPMVGTFYRSPGPNEKPFVDVGTSVKKGSVLCIIEAMKMLNQIEAEVSGVIKQILVNNAEPVEFGQPLFVISES